MKVSELIEILEEQDPDADVLVMSQESWPYEVAIRGVTTREEILLADGDEDGCAEAPAGAAHSDVFLVEGEQLRYGSKSAWAVATR